MESKKDIYEKVVISKESLLKNFNQESGKNIHWTDDVNVELPVIQIPGDDVPIKTIPQLFKETMEARPTMIALRVKRRLNPKSKQLTYVNWSWEQYYQDCMKFACALVKMGITQRKSVNIIGFNAPEWAIAFFGTIFANCLPCGVYTTNNPEACLYQAEHSQCQLLIVENDEQLIKYVKVIDRMPRDFKGFVVYDENIKRIRELYPDLAKRIMSWTEFLDFGGFYTNTDGQVQEVQRRILLQKPSICCNLVYTSGTTGPPKGVMLSHDNMIFNMQQAWRGMVNEVQFQDDGNERCVSYLPLCHSAAQCADLILPMIGKIQLTFAKPDALQGSLVETLKEVRPTAFFSVPRVWEKMEEKMREFGANKPKPFRMIADWAKGKAYQGVMSQQSVKDKPEMPWGYPIAKYFILNRVKSALGLDECKLFQYAAAPMSKRTHDYFASLDIPIISIYGMTESSGASTTWSRNQAKAYTCGHTLFGTKIKIDNPDKDGVGEICMKGRHCFLGYYKNEKATREMYDQDGYIHSGDLGTMTDGFLEIKGRIKELIITAGGENVAPLLIEDIFKQECALCSNIMVVGDDRKFLSALISVKVQVDVKSGVPSANLTSEAKTELKNHVKGGDKFNTINDLKQSKKFREYIQKCLDRTNERVISRAQQIRKWEIIDSDFSIPGGELTPSLKMKRKFIENKHKDIIERMYGEAKL